jgi:hypothetical protein
MAGAEISQGRRASIQPKPKTSILAAASATSVSDASPQHRSKRAGSTSPRRRETASDVVGVVLDPDGIASGRPPQAAAGEQRSLQSPSPHRERRGEGAHRAAKRPILAQAASRAFEQEGRGLSHDEVFKLAIAYAPGLLLRHHEEGLPVGQPVSQEARQRAPLATPAPNPKPPSADWSSSSR